LIRTCVNRLLRFALEFGSKRFPDVFSGIKRMDIEIVFPWKIDVFPRFFRGKFPFSVPGNNQKGGGNNE